MNIIKPLTLLLAIILLASCYNYDGPLRESNNKAYSTNSSTSNTTQQSNVYTPQPEKISSQAYLAKMASAIKKRLPQAEVQLLEDSIKVLFPDNIVYDKNRMAPKMDVYKPIGKLAGLINKFDQTDILITGHSDNVGNKALNKKISKLRAQYIHDLLVAYKVNRSRLAFWGLGGIAPISSNNTEMGRAKNRRVEFVILSTITD